MAEIVELPEAVGKAAEEDADVEAATGATELVLRATVETALTVGGVVVDDRRRVVVISPNDEGMTVPYGLSTAARSDFLSLLVNPTPNPIDKAKMMMIKAANVAIARGLRYHAFFLLDPPPTHVGVTVASFSPLPSTRGSALAPVPVPPVPALTRFASPPFAEVATLV